MTLGKLIERLEAMPSEQVLDGIKNPHSYRGYYCDLAFESGHETSVNDAILICKSAANQVFEGYKGGEFLMGLNTPVWIANNGTTGRKMLALRDDGTFELADANNY